MLLSTNLNTSVGLSNGAIGVVKDIVYKDGKSAPELPQYVWVDFDGYYCGESFFEDDDRKGWFPVFPLSVDHFTAKKNSDADDTTKHTRTMLHLRLAWS